MPLRNVRYRVKRLPGGRQQRIAISKRSGRVVEATRPSKRGRSFGAAKRVASRGRSRSGARRGRSGR